MDSDTIQDISEELGKIKTQSDEYLAGWKRAKADLVNYQKQAERERADWFLFANAGCVKAFLPVLDSLDQAVERHSAHREGTDVQDGLAHGIAKIRDQMLDVLRQMGVEQIITVGEPVNAEFHEAIGIEKSDRHAPGIIVKEVQRGYIMHGKVLRVAKVIVAE